MEPRQNDDPNAKEAIEFVTPSHWSGDLWLVVENQHGVARTAVQVTSPPPPFPPEPDVERVMFTEANGNIFGYVFLSKPLASEQIAVVGNPAKYDSNTGERQSQEVVPIMVLFPQVRENPTLWEAEIRGAEEKGLTVLRPETFYGGSAIAFIVPEPFASKGLAWLNAKEENGGERLANIWVDVESRH